MVLFLHFSALVAATFNYTRCPAPWKLQSDLVKKSFNLTEFQGTYYELALHDYTQYPHNDMSFPNMHQHASHKVIDYKLQQVNSRTWCTPSAIILELLPTVYRGTFFVFPINLFLSREKIPGKKPTGFRVNCLIGKGCVNIKNSCNI